MRKEKCGGKKHGDKEAKIWKKKEKRKVRRKGKIG